MLFIQKLAEVLAALLNNVIDVITPKLDLDDYITFMLKSQIFEHIQLNLKNTDVLL